jgi:hypothetical protein
LLVSENEKKGITEFIFVEHALKLFSGLNNTITIIAVYNEDNALGVLEVVSPKRTNLVLTTHVPHSKLNVLVFNRLHIETCMMITLIS